MAKKATVGFIQTAASQLGYKEQAGGWTKFGDWYAKNFAKSAWCAMFMSWCLAQNGISSLGKFASTVAWAKWLKANGKWGTTPQVGALVFFDWGGSKNLDAIDHVGVVTRIMPDGRIRTIEGNTSNMVAERLRSPSVIVGYGYLDGTVGTAPAPAAAAKPNPTPLIKKGARGDAVKKAQKALCDKGFKVTVDGIFGPDMRIKVMAFQTKMKLKPVDGEIGKDTWKALLAK